MDIVILIELSQIERRAVDRQRQRMMQEFKGEDYPTSQQIAQGAHTAFLISCGLLPLKRNDESDTGTPIRQSP